MNNLISCLVCCLLASSGNSQRVPDYWNGKIWTTFNGTQSAPVPFKVYSENGEYNQQDTARDNLLKTKLSFLTNQLSGVNPSNVPPENKTGTEHKVVLTDGFITHMEVLDEYNHDGTGTVPVRICTSWQKDVPAENWNHSSFYLEEAVNSDTLLNMTLTTGWVILSDAEVATIDTSRYWELDEYLCYYQGTRATMVNGKCVMPYSEIIQYFLDLWHRNYVETYQAASRRQVSNNLTFLQEYNCSCCSGHGLNCRNSSFEIIEYVDPINVWLPTIYTWYKYATNPSGIGYAINITFGYNKIRHSYDLNYTVIFDKWTFDLPHGFLSAFRDSSFLYHKFKFEIFYWTENPTDITVRTAPASFLIMVFIMIFPFVILFAGAVMLILTCSKKTFNVRLWEFKRDQEEKGITEEKAKKLKQQELEHQVELRKEQEAEEYLAGLEKKEADIV